MSSLFIDCQQFLSLSDLAYGLWFMFYGLWLMAYWIVEHLVQACNKLFERYLSSTIANKIQIATEDNFQFQMVALN